MDEEIHLVTHIPIITLKIWKSLGLNSDMWEEYTNPYILKNHRIISIRKKPYEFYDWFLGTRWQIISDYVNNSENDVLGTFRTKDSAERILSILVSHGART